MVEKKISFGDCIDVLEKYFKIKNIRFMRNHIYGIDIEIHELPEYILGKEEK